MRPLFITATADYVEQIDEGTPGMDLKPLVTEAVGASVRRIGRFIQLALIGAGRCAKQTQLAPDTSVYLGSGRGDLEVTIEVMQNLLRDGHAPKPLSFINTVSNAACYYVAHSLKLMSHSSFVCNRYFAFEAVLQLAALDLEGGLTERALVGTVDVVVPPLANHRIRVGLSSDTPVGDATHWIELRAERTNQTLAQLVACEQFADRESLQRWLGNHAEWKDARLATGQFMHTDEASAWSQELNLQCFDYRTSRPYYDSQSGAAINAFVQSNESKLLHLNRDPSGRYAVLLLGKREE